MNYQSRRLGSEVQDQAISLKMSSLLSYFISIVTPLFLPASVQESGRTPQPSPSTPPSLFQYRCHRLVDQVAREVDDWFLKNWNFENESSRRKFVAAGFSRVTCLYFPMALDDRIHFACELLTILFLIDDVLDHMSFDDGEAYNNKLMPIMRGNVLPDRSIPVQAMMYDLWENMRAHDKAMADEILEPVFVFMRAQTDRTRAAHMSLGHYFEYREKDVGKALLSALMRFSMKLEMSPSELDLCRPVERNCSKHISVINDIYSFEKEVAAAKTGHQEGAAVCSSVQIMSEESDLSVPGSKRVLFLLCREWEAVHQQLVIQRESEKCTPAMAAYMKGLEYQMSGNEQWSHTTKRYNNAADF